WARKASAPTPRSEVAAAAVGATIVLLGGSGRGTVNEVYDVAANSWQKRAPLPLGVNHAGAAAVGDKVYLVGGFDDSNRPLATTSPSPPSAACSTRSAGAWATSRAT